MSEVVHKAKLIAVLAMMVFLAVVAVMNLRERLNTRPIPYDGLELVDTADGVRVRSVAQDSPLAFSVREGDYIRAIFYRGLYEKIDRAETLALYLERQGVGGDGLYVVEHSSQVLQGIYGIGQPLYDADFKVAARPQYLGRELYLAFIGLVYLAIGLFVLFKQGRAALTYHFFAWALVSFAVYFLTPTGEFSRFDKLISFIDSAALALLAPLFLHFCGNFPYGKGRLSNRLVLTSALYLPATVLIALEVMWHYTPGIFAAGTLVSVRTWLEGAGFIHLLAYMLAGGVLLLRTYSAARTQLLRKQLRWIIWALGVAVLPLAALYLVVGLARLGVSMPAVSPTLETLASVPLILIPLSFGYSIVRYRMMDVDVIVRRSFVHVMAMAAVGAIYMAVLLGVSDLVKYIWPTADLNSYKTKLIIVAGMLVVAMLFAPIKNRLQVWADRWFYGERYTLRTGLQEFGRTLAQTTALPQLLDSLVRRLSDMLSVERVAIFIEEGSSLSGFRLTHSIGVEEDVHLPENIRNMIRAGSIGRGFISARDIGRYQAGADYDEDSPPVVDVEDASDGLYYFVPCVVRDRMVAIIAVGRTTTGSFLTSEDTELLRALSGYVAVAIENSLLYRSEREKAEELARLKEFSENVIESVNVGIMVVDFDGYVTTWNTALESVFGISRERAKGRSADDLLDADLIQTIRNATGQRGWALRETRHIYKYTTSTEDGRPLILNISLAPFEAARGVVTGALVVFENVTERANLEHQLLEREKLSSIGLLAAGVAHEVNTPLAGISSYAQMLMGQISESDPSHKLLEKINDQTKRASGIVSNLLNFSRTGDSQFREVEVNRVLDDTFQLLEPQLRNTGIEIRRIYSSDLPPAHGNGSKLQQVFMNLILNARDAMAGGGTLTVQTRAVDSSVVIDFKDTGVGIAPENIARIYDPFFTTKDIGQGTGLGLALSYGIIQEHGGRIFVESRPGDGAHFTIKLPTVFSRQMQVASD